MACDAINCARDTTPRRLVTCFLKELQYYQSGFIPSVLRLTVDPAEHPRAGNEKLPI